MSDVVTVDGSLYIGPSTPGDATFPAGSVNEPLSTKQAQKNAPVSSGLQKRAVASPAAYVALSGVGATDTVAQGNFLYIRADNPVLVRLTFYKVGGDIVSVIPLDGPLVLEIDSSSYLKLLEVQGTAKVEWAVTGNQ